MSLTPKISLTGTSNIGQILKGDPFVFSDFTEEQLESLRGPEGRTPVKGVDYYTEEEVEAITAHILSKVMLGATPSKIGYVTLLASEWVEEDKHQYSQVVTIDGVTENSQVDITPSIEQLAIFYEKDLTFVTENEDGIVTVHAIGQKPTNDYTIQVTITEVTL